MEIFFVSHFNPTACALAAAQGMSGSVNQVSVNGGRVSLARLGFLADVQAKPDDVANRRNAVFLMRQNQDAGTE
jgi:hypothetical protein